MAVEKKGVAGEVEVKVNYKAQAGVEKKTNEKGTYYQSVFTDKKNKLNTVLVLDPNSKYPFKFGIRKAHIILANLKSIRAFAADYPEDGKGAKPIVDREKLIQRTNEDGVSYITKCYTNNKDEDSPMIVMDHDSRFPLQFGPPKARLVIANSKAIKAFCLDNPKVDDEEES